MLNNDGHKHNGSQPLEPAEIKNAFFWKCYIALMLALMAWYYVNNPCVDARVAAWLT